jgi:S-adenosylhomocysteine hydrolase
MPAKRVKSKKGGSVNRVGRSVAASRRDPDIDTMITEVKPQKSMHTMENGPLMSKTKGAQYASGGEVVVRGTGAARTQKARIC